MDYSNKNIEKSLFKTVTDPELSNLLQDYAEVGIDAVFNSEIVDAIPVVKTLSALVKGKATIQDRIFLKKLARFLAQANKMSLEERDKWYKQYIERNAKRKTELSDKLIIMIDSVNDEYKSDVIGKLFLAFVKGDIKSLDEFYFMSELVLNCYTNILKGLAIGKEFTDEALYRMGIKHASGPTGKDIIEVIDKDVNAAGRGLTSTPRLPSRKAEYTSAGKLLIHILKTY